MLSISRLVSVGLVVTAAVVSAQDAHHHTAAPATPANGPVAISTLRIPDVELVDQNGRKARFYSGLVKGKVVAINTVFTTCTTICPLMGANFAKLSKLLSNQDAGKLMLISISIDPAVDTPERLKRWSSAFGPAGANWTLLTGAKADIDTLLKSLQVFTAEKQDHAPVVLIGGGDAAGDWARASALLPPTQIAELIQTRLTRH